MQYPIIDLITDAYLNNGWTGLKLTEGKNLFNGTFRQGNYNSLDVLNTVTAENRPEAVIGEYYTITINNLPFSQFRYVVYGAQTQNGITLGAHPDTGWITTNTVSIQMNDPSNPYIGISINSLSGNITPNNLPSNIEIQIEKGTEATPYEPYVVSSNDFPNRLKLPLPHYFPHPVIDALQRAATGTQTADDTEILRHYLTPLGIGGI